MGFARKNIGVGCHFLFQGLFPAERSNPCLLHLSALSQAWGPSEHGLSRTQAHEAGPMGEIGWSLGTLSLCKEAQVSMQGLG